MKVCGIEIDKNNAIFYSIEEDGQGNLSDATSKIKSLAIQDDSDDRSVKEFVDVLTSHFDSMNYDKIAILKRQTKGRFSSAPISFKVEGLIQLYPAVHVELISPATVRSFIKKNAIPINPTFKYQQNALNLAFYLIAN